MGDNAVTSNIASWLMHLSLVTQGHSEINSSLFSNFRLCEWLPIRFCVLQ